MQKRSGLTSESDGIWKRCCGAIRAVNGFIQRVGYSALMVVQWSIHRVLYSETAAQDLLCRTVKKLRIATGVIKQFPNF